VRIRTAPPIALMAVVLAGCGAPAPTTDPGRVVTVVNASARAIMVQVGPPLSAPATAARPCGGTVSMAVTPDRFTEDGRLVATFAVGADSTFDAALDGWAGDPADLPGEFPVEIIWSSGELAGRLPLTLGISPELVVTDGAPSGPPAAECATP
jgi:hypothetical protein